MAIGRLFKLVGKGVEEVLEQITQQGNILENRVRGPIDRALGRIVGGAWEGDDADAMVGEIRGVLLPMIVELIQAIAGMGSGVSNAADLILKRDIKLRSLAEDMGDVFAGIAPGIK